ncbi:MAG: DUF2075 domain-containing protein [Oceanospirillaceae bacterium]|nr:DUF2075 domain-containing protein [Oceanospirillaceae bacterium]MCP5334661.1 DUF2075 domain-containing protein [Oceanospirillaceae bacterium]
MATRALYQAKVSEFIKTSDESIIGGLALGHRQDLVEQQTKAWKAQIELLKRELSYFPEAYILFEYSIPRMGKRIDTIVFYKGLLFVLEFKVGDKKYQAEAKRQVMDYCLDLHNFHEASTNTIIFPVLIATDSSNIHWQAKPIDRGISDVILTNGKDFKNVIKLISEEYKEYTQLTFKKWLDSPYKPTPSIIEAARALYSNHQVKDILQADAGAQNLERTTKTIKEIIHRCNINKRKAICFVTGVPGAGKTLVGLNIATDENRPIAERAVYLSGNGPLVNVLREALFTDRKLRGSIPTGRSTSDIKQEVYASIQNIHHFRDDALKSHLPPDEQVVIFDEAQRAWDEHKLKKEHPAFDGDTSEPDFLIGVMDRHENWCVIVALVGSGQEINDGEAGISAWLRSKFEKYPHWDIYCPDQIELDTNLKGALKSLPSHDGHIRSSLHLATSMRSFRAESYSQYIEHVIAGNSEKARHEYKFIKEKYPIVVTRDLLTAKTWLRSMRRGSDRMGILSSSSGKRLRAVGIFNSKETDETKWFLEPEGDIRSSNALEEAASEFKVQGLELDWAIVGWDADFRFNGHAFEHLKFGGSNWKRRHKESNQRYLENSYRVLLTRARQGIVIFVPFGDESDQTRLPEFYDKTYDYLLSCGIPTI